jgi:hypothetical protein
MRCSEVRAALPEFVYGDLPAAVQADVEAHLGGCANCRREADALRQVRRLLSAPPAPEVRVDAAAIYRRAMEQQARRLRLWRRAALVACAAAVLAATLTALSRLEVRVGASELVVRWGQAPAVQPSPAAAPAPAVTPPPAGPAPASQADLAAVEERLRVLSDLTQALADDGQARDYRRGQEIAGLRQQVREWQGRSAERLTSMQKDFDALYLAHFANQKGVNP